MNGSAGEVAIIGASSAGLFAAELLARGGVPVDVYERAERLQPAPRTLIITPELTRVLGYEPEPAIVHRVQKFDLRANGTFATVTLQDPDLVVERDRLLQLLARRAEAAGARLHYGHRLTAIEPHRHGATLTFQRTGTDREEHAVTRTVLGADGAHSSVARAVGLPKPRQISLLQARVPLLPTSDDPAVSRVWFRPAETPYFFWLVPESPTCAVIGLADDTRADLRPRLDRFLREHGYVANEYQAARIPWYGPGPTPSKRVGGAQVHLVGDAAGQVKVTTVGGTVTGLRGAQAAARAILRGTSYRRELHALNAELALHWGLRRLLHRFGTEEYVSLLRSLNERLHALLHSRNRDRLVGGLLPMLAAQPQLMVLAVRSAALGKTVAA